MNNKKYEIYKEIFLTIRNIITQNNVYQFEIETVTTDSELALIKAIKTVFPKIKHFIVCKI